MAIHDLQAELKLQKEINESLGDRLETLQALQRKKLEHTEVYKDHLKLYKEEKADLKAVEEAIKKLKKANDEYNASVDETKSALNQLTGINMQLLDSIKKGADGYIDWEKSATSASKTVLSAMLKFTMSLDKQQVGLARTTGYATDLNDNMLALADANTGLYLSLDQSAQVIGGLSLGFRDFNALSEDSQRSTAELAGNFLNMGVQASSTAAGLDKLKKGMNFSQVAAEATMKSFKKLSVEIGSPLGQIVEDFNDLAPSLARFGTAGVGVFKDLANQARSLGLTTRQAFDFTEMFDTFESSADVAGKLNAQLGLQLNSVEMMAASSEERLKILRAEFSMQGTHFKDMSRRQKQMVAEIMGTDVDSASRLFGDPMEMRKFQREQANDEKRMKSFIEISQRWQSSLQQFFINMEPLLSVFRDMMVGFGELVNKVMANDFGRFGSMLVGFAATIRVVVKSMGFLGQAFSKFFGIALTALQAGLDIYEIYKSITGQDGADGGNMWPNIAKLLGGILGGAIGAAVGGPLGMGIGYTLGSMAASKLVPAQMNDGETQGGGVISQPGKRPIQTRPDDTIFMGTGDIHRTLKQIADNTSGAQSQKFTISAPIQIDLQAEGFREKVIKDVMIEFNPTS